MDAETKQFFFMEVSFRLLDRVESYVLMLLPQMNVGSNQRPFQHS